MTGDSECRTGSPTMARTRLLAPTWVTVLAQKAIDGCLDEVVQLDVGLAIELEIAPERIADLRFRSSSSGILSQDVGAPHRPARAPAPGGAAPWSARAWPPGPD